MLKHILTLIKAQGKSNAWVFVELMLVFALLWRSVDSLLMQTLSALQPEGISVENVCKLTLGTRPATSPSYVDYPEGSDEAGRNYLRIIERLRSHPDIEAATFCQASAAPFTYHSSSRPYWADTICSTTGTMTFDVDPDYFRVFDIHETGGGAPQRLTQALADGWVVSQTMSDEMAAKVSLGDKASLRGKWLAYYKGDSTRYRINAIAAPLKKQGFDQPRAVVFEPIREKDVVRVGEKRLSSFQIYFRLRPGVKGSADYASRFKSEMKHGLTAGNFWLADVQYMPVLREKFLDNSLEMNGRRLEIAINLFLLVNVFLAIIGTFWFRVNRRRSELGLRMAVGSTRRNLQWLVIGEGLVMLTVVALPALVICLNLAFAGLIKTEVMEITFPRLLAVSLLTWAILAAVIILAVWYPSRKASRLEPAEALHYE